MRLIPRLLSCAVAALLVGCGGGGSTASKYPVDTTVINPGQQLASPARWYDDAAIYEVWVGAFADGIYNDGIGDLPGIQGKLDYLQTLGVNTLWLSPIMACANMGADMNGYDITDYYSLNPAFGEKADLANLINAIHARGMRVVFDFVPNHTSSAHGWFTTPGTRGTWYIPQSTLPAGWGYPWGGGDSNDVWVQLDGSYFYSAFGTTTLIDLNYYNPDTVAAIQAVEGYWLDCGFDGMRVDSARYLCEEGPGLAADQPDTHNRLQGFRALIDQYAVAGGGHPAPDGDPTQVSVKMMMAEAWTPDATGIGPYYGNGANEFNMCLDFSAPWAVYNAITTPDATQLTNLWDYEQANYPPGYRSATFDSNHDNVISRPATQYNGNQAQIILAEALNLLSPGTPVLYYGNEVGMPGLSGTDTNLRQPMDWTAVAAQTAQPDSILNWCTYLLQARRTYPSLRGAYATLATDVGTGKALAYLRTAGAEQVFLVANLTNATQDVTVTNLTAFGVPATGPVSPILGSAGANTALQGGQFTATGIPAYGFRVYYVAGGAFQGNIHPDHP